MPQVIPKHLPDIACQSCHYNQKDRGQLLCLHCQRPLVRDKPPERGLTLHDEQLLEQEILRRNEWPG